MANYDNVRGLGRSIYRPEEGVPRLDEEGLKIEEFYYDSHMGNLMLHFYSQKQTKTWERTLLNGGFIRIEHTERLDEEESHMVDIPVKANDDWNGFVESLPKWEDQ